MTTTVSVSSFSNQMNDSTVLFGTDSRTRRARRQSNDSSSSDSRHGVVPPNTPSGDDYKPRRRSEKRAQSLPAPKKPSLLQRTKTQLEEIKHKAECKIHDLEDRVEHRIEDAVFGDVILPREEGETKRHHRQEKKHLRHVSPHTAETERRKSMDDAFEHAANELMTRTLRGDESPFRKSLEHFGERTLRDLQKENYFNLFGRR